MCYTFAGTPTYVCHSVTVCPRLIIGMCMAVEAFIPTESQGFLHVLAGYILSYQLLTLLLTKWLKYLTWHASQTQCVYQSHTCLIYIFHFTIHGLGNSFLSPSAPVCDFEFWTVSCRFYWCCVSYALFNEKLIGFVLPINRYEDGSMCWWDVRNPLSPVFSEKYHSEPGTVIICWCTDHISSCQCF